LNQIDSAVSDKLHSARVPTDQITLRQFKTCLGHWSLEFGVLWHFSAIFARDAYRPGTGL